MIGQSSELELCDTGWDGFSGGYDRVRVGAPVRRWLGKIQVLFDWIGQEHIVIPVESVMMMDRSFPVCTLYPKAVRVPRLTSLTAERGT